MTFLTNEQQKLLGTKYSIEQMQAVIDELHFVFSKDEYMKRIKKILSKQSPPYQITCMTEEEMHRCDNTNK